MLYNDAICAETENPKGGDPGTIEDAAHPGTYYVYNTAGYTYVTNDLVHFTPIMSFTHDGFPDFSRCLSELSSGSPWAPDAIYFGGKYYMVYAFSSGFGSQKSVIGILTNKQLDPSLPGYKWTEIGDIVSSKTGDPFNAIDPSLYFEKGRLWLVWGSFWGGNYLQELDTNSFNFITGSYPINVNRAPDLKHYVGDYGGEGPYLYKRGRYYYLFSTRGDCCRQASPGDYATIVGRAEKIEGPYLDKKGRLLSNGFGTLILNSYTFSEFPAGIVHERPGHGDIKDAFGSTFFIAHEFYDETKQATDRSVNAWEVLWTEDGWPAIGEPKSDNWTVKKTGFSTTDLAGTWEIILLRDDTTGIINGNKNEVFELLPNGYCISQSSGQRYSWQTDIDRGTISIDLLNGEKYKLQIGDGGRCAAGYSAPGNQSVRAKQLSQYHVFKKDDLINTSWILHEPDGKADTITLHADSTIKNNRGYRWEYLGCSRN